jgi:hypothetical protein
MQQGQRQKKVPILLANVYYQEQGMLLFIICGRHYLNVRGHGNAWVNPQKSQFGIFVQVSINLTPAFLFHS